MTDQRISEITDADVAEVIELWRASGLTRPWNDPEADIAFARSAENATILLLREPDRLAASAMVGHDGHRGTVYYLAVAPGDRGRGLGREIMRAAEAWLLGRGVWKLNLVVRAENEHVISFYRAIGYEVEERTNLARWIDPDRAPASKQ